MLNGAAWRPKAPGPREGTAQRQDVQPVAVIPETKPASEARVEKARRNPKEEKHFPPLGGFGTEREVIAVVEKPKILDLFLKSVSTTQLSR